MTADATRMIVPTQRYPIDQSTNAARTADGDDVEWRSLALVKEKRGRAFLRVPARLLAEMLFKISTGGAVVRTRTKLPPDVELVGVSYRFENDTFFLCLESYAFPRTELGWEIPHVEQFWWADEIVIEPLVTEPGVYR